jgi:hypothetical protein
MKTKTDRSGTPCSDEDITRQPLERSLHSFLEKHLVEDMSM